MANRINATFDMSGWEQAFDLLDGPFKESLARRMAVEGGVALRDEAKTQVPQSVGPYNPKSRGSQEAETLRNSIYLARDDKQSTETLFSYTISWNSKQAWWGKLVEFGYIRRYKVYFNEKMGYFTTIKTLPLDKTVIVPAHPFLGSAYDVTLPRLFAIMTARGQRELPILLAEMGA